MKTLYFNGTIITMDKEMPEVEAVLIENNKIIALGNYEELLKKTNQATKKFDLKGMTLLPGFIESHAHAAFFARTLQFVDLATPALGGKVENIADIKKVFKEELANNPKKYDENNWLIGYRYDYNNFPNNERLTKLDLDEISTEIPIFVNHMSTHAGVASSKMLTILGISEDTIDPDDPSFERIPGTKEPNGVLKEDAYMRFSEIIDENKISNNQETWVDLWKPVVSMYAAQGYTAIKDGNMTKGQYDFLNYLDQKNDLILDVIGHVSGEDEELLSCMKERWAQDNSCANKLKIKGIKLIIDGTLELWTAWLSKRYCTQINGNPPNYAGGPTINLNLAYDRIAWCLMNNKQIIAHCIGDQASETFINLYQEALAETKNTNDLRPIMIHATTVRNDQLQRMKEISMTPSFLVEDVYYFDDFYRYLLGAQRSETLAPWGWAKRLAIEFSLHHDSPIFMPNSMMTLHTAISRMTFYGELLGQDQQISIEDALAALTINAAYQFHEEDVRGSITVNKYADFVILNHSPLAIASNRIKDIKVMCTIKDGQVIYINYEF